MTGPGLSDLYQLGQQLDLDKAVSVHELRRRDHDIGARCADDDEVDRLLCWLRELPKSPEESAAPGPARIDQRTVVTMARVAALVLGLLSMGGFLLAGTESRINVLAFLFVFVFLQLALCGLGLLVMIRSLRGNPPTVLPVNPARFALDRLFPDRRYLRECQGVVRLVLLRYGQELGVIFTLAAAAVFFPITFGSGFAFVWSSTFDSGQAFIENLTTLLAWPWSSWHPAAVPSVELVEASRIASWQSIDPAAGERLREWRPFLTMNLLFYALLPRIFLWILSLLFYRRMMRVSMLDYPGARNVLARMKAPVVQTQATEPEETHAFSQAPVALDDGLMLLEWAGALGGEESGNFEQLRPVPPGNVQRAGLASLEEDEQALAGIDRYRPETLLVAVKSWEPPMADLGDFLGRLDQVRRCTLCLVPLPGRPVGDRDLQDWTSFARELPFDTVASQALERL